MWTLIVIVIADSRQQQQPPAAAPAVAQIIQNNNKIQPPVLCIIRINCIMYCIMYYVFPIPGGHTHATNKPPTAHTHSPQRGAGARRGALRANSPEIQVLDQSNTRLIQLLAKLGQHQSTVRSGALARASRAHAHAAASLVTLQIVRATYILKVAII
jgi:hypothetical protein